MLTRHSRALRRGALTLLAAASAAAVLPLAATAAAAEVPSRGGAAVEVQGFRGVQGPFGSDHDCRVVNGEFQRYYRTDSCYHSYFPNYPEHTGWYFAYYDK